MARRGGTPGGCTLSRKETKGPAARHLASLTSFVGRERELAAADQRLRQPEVRLVTLTGPPGIGKTTLARRLLDRVAEEFDDGVIVVSLEAAHDASLVMTTIASALGIAQSAGRSEVEQVADWFGDRRVLLVLDNFEQVIDAAPVLPELLERARRTTCLVTSREALVVRGEHEVPVPPLPVPDVARFQGMDAGAIVQALQQYPSVRLFCDRARAVEPAFELTPDNWREVAAACGRLDGIPLALELAASRLKVMSLEALGQQLDRAASPGLLNVLGRGRRDSPQRHRTLDAAIDWSYQLLDPQEQRLFRALGVFADGWTLEAAGALMRALAIEGAADPFDAMATLAGKSLVHRVDAPGGGARWSMLQALRAYALTRLEGEAAEWRAAHEWQFGWALDLVQGSRPAPPERLEVERGNLRGALEWALGGDNPGAALRLGAALWRFWLTRSHLFEGRHWLQRILERGGPRDLLRARVLYGAAMLARQQGDVAELERCLTDALDVLQACPRDEETAMAIASASTGLARVLAVQGGSTRPIASSTVAWPCFVRPVLPASWRPVSRPRG